VATLEDYLNHEKPKFIAWRCKQSLV
jgi:hypothetical protein